MSWSGPVAGAAPYQPPYANGHPSGYTQPGYGQHHNYQYSQNPGYGQYQSSPAYPPAGPPQPLSDSRPPKKKGNPIITRYPPPPGYRGPAQKQPPFGATHFGNQYPAHHSGYPPTSQAQSTYPGQYPNQGYPPQSFGAPQPPNYPAQQYPHGPGNQWPQQQSYPPNQNYPQAPFNAGGQGYAAPQNGQQHYPSQQGPIDPRQQPFKQGGAWPQPPQPAQPPYPPNSQGGLPRDQSMTGPNATPTQATVHMVSAPPATASSHPTGGPHDQNSGDKPKLFLGWDDWDFDFEGAIWPKSNEPVDPSLSLGVIVWHPAKQVTRALPSTFAEAEDQALKPTPDTLGNGDSVSIYFTAENSHEAFLNVRQMEEWDAIRNDPVFVVFTDEDMKRNLVTLEDCIAQRDRPDESLEAVNEQEDEVMDEVDWSVMDNLEQALSSGGKDMKLKTDPKPTGDETQEDVLARLGVTGSPKPHSDEHRPFPISPTDERASASLPEKPGTHFPSSTSSRPQPPLHLVDDPQNTPRQSIPPHRYGSMSSTPGSRSLPPPPPPEPQRYTPWNSSNAQTRHNGHATLGSRASSAASEGSNGTMAGSDFESDRPAQGEHSASLPPHLHRSDSSFSRKRGHEDSDQDDYTKRKRRSQVVDAAYSRR